MNATANLDFFRAVYAGSIAFAVAVQFPAHWRWVRERGERRELPRLLSWMPMPRLGAGSFASVAGVFLTCLALAASGLAVAPALFAAGVAALVYFAQVIELPAVRRKPNTVPVILALLGAVVLLPAGAADARAGLCPLMIKLLLAQIYFSSALVKLSRGGAEWMRGTNFQMALLRYRLRDGNRLAEWMARRPVMCRAAATFVLLFELLFWLVIPFPVLAWVFVPAGVAFHVGTAVLMRIHYWIYLGPAYLIFCVS